MKTSVIHKTKTRAHPVPVSEQREIVSPLKPASISPRSSCEDLHALIAMRAYELYNERGYRGASALDDWLDAEREILSQIPPV